MTRDTNTEPTDANRLTDIAMSSISGRRVRVMLFVFVLFSSVVAMPLAYTMTAPGQSEHLGTAEAAQSDTAATEITATLYNSTGDEVESVSIESPNGTAGDHIAWGMGGVDADDYVYFDDLMSEDGTTIESFPNNSLDNYDVTPQESYESADLVRTPNVSGSNSLRLLQAGGAYYISSTDGSGISISEGEDFSYYSRISDSSVEGSSARMLFGIDSERQGGFQVNLDKRNSNFAVSDRSGTTDSQNIDVENGEWYRIEVDWSVSDSITGHVTDQSGNSVGGAEVTFRDVATGSETTTQTDPTGDFDVTVESGRYEIEISAEGYQTLTATRDIEEGEDLGTFQLEPQQLDLQFNRYVEPGDSTPYTVELTDDNGTDVDVTEDVTVISSNVSIATVDTNTTEIVGSDGVNGTSEITANYTVGNTTYTTTRTVTVATKTVDNLEILPGTWRFSALLEDITIQVILVGIGAAIIATRAASSWAGLGAMELVLIIGWFGGWVPIGIAMLGLFTALFIGLNLAANIDYSVRR